jgi:protein O-mannosyl-transferase
MSNATAGAKQPDEFVLHSLGPFASPQKRTLVVALLLVVFTLALYNQANHFSFINYDDNHYVSDNPHVRAGISWPTLRWAFTTFYYANWHPLTWISHALDCQLYRLNPAGHHFTSILIHTLNAVLLFLLLARSTGRAGPSFFVAALFAVHPLNVESVAWIAERKNVLSTMFLLLTLGAYGWYALKPGWKRYCAVACLLACGLASKPMLVTAPFVLLLVDYWPLGRIQGWTAPSNTLAIKQSPVGRLFLEKLPLLLLAGASSVITLRAQRASGAVGTLPFPPGARLENGIYSYAMYLRKTIWPTHLSPFYPYWGHSLPLWKVGTAGLLLIALSSVVLKLRRRGYLLTGWLWFLGTLIPVIGVVQVGNQAMADRYAYVPLIGVFVMIAWAAADWAEQKKLGPAPGFVAAICVLAALSVVTYRQIGYWRDSLDVWTHALNVTQHSFVAEDNMGVSLVELNRVEEAYPFFVRAAQDEPNDPVARLNIGTYLDQHGRPTEAVQQYELALHLGAEPELLAATYTNLGSAYSELGDDTKSQASFEQALRINPDQASAWQGMAFALQKQGRLEAAITCLARAVELQPSGQGYLQLARVLLQANRRAEAQKAYEQALRMSPDLMMTH